MDISYPYTLFKTSKHMEDYGADDMRYGDLSEAELKQHFGLHQVSHFIDPYTLKRINPISHGRWQRPVYTQIMTALGQKQALSVKDCTDLLFKEFKEHAKIFAIYGPYRSVIEQMIDHMQYHNGTPFSSLLLDQALSELIQGDKSEYSIFNVIKINLIKNIDWELKKITSPKILAITEDIRRRARLPKFTKLWHTFDGTKITVHDIHATHIILESLKIENGQFHASVHFKTQDHFGLDKLDIMKYRNHPMFIFRIWFILQRYQRFGFRPFMTNIKATVKISGNASKNQ